MDIKLSILITCFFSVLTQTFGKENAECKEDYLIEVLSCLSRPFDDLIGSNRFLRQLNEKRREPGTAYFTNVTVDETTLIDNDDSLDLPVTNNLDSNIRRNMLHYSSDSRKYNNKFKNAQKILLTARRSRTKTHPPNLTAHRFRQKIGETVVVAQKQMRKINRLKNMPRDKDLIKKSVKHRSERFNHYKVVNDDDIDEWVDILCDMLDISNNDCDDIKNASRWIDNNWDKIKELMDMLDNVLNCLDGFTEQEMEDDIQFASCFFKCNDAPVIAECAIRHLENCSSESRGTGLAITKIAMDTLKLGKCTFEITSPSNISADLTLVEGDEIPQIVSVKHYLPPSLLCINMDLEKPLETALNEIINVFDPDNRCDVSIQLSLSNYLQDLIPYVRFRIPELGVNVEEGLPKCHNLNERLLTQSVIGKIYPQSSGNGSCLIQINDNNWKNEFHIPVLATIDNKVDGDIRTRLTIRHFVNDELKKYAKVPIVVKDRDPPTLSACQAINDPHLITFDGLYFNNFMEGVFILYRDLEIQNEVQIIFQPCDFSINKSHNASCGCAVAVRFTDDVIVIDRCRRTLAKESVSFEPPMSAIVYQNGALSKGFEIKSEDQGQRFKVTTPLGTQLKIMMSNENINVIVIPSVFEINKTEGLCGTFNGDRTDDLKLRNGTIFTHDENSPPDQFSNDWRVNLEDSIFGGVNMSNYRSTNDTKQHLSGLHPFCRCHAELITGFDCDPSCDCSGNKLTDFCEDHSLQDRGFVQSLLRRPQTDGAGPYSLKDIVLDVNKLSQIMPNISDEEKKLARQKCDERFNEDAVITKCRETSIPKNFTEAARRICVEDLLITNDTRWIHSALELARETCVEELIRSIQTEPKILNEILSIKCPLDCLGNGKCQNGTCMCDNGFKGPDCSTPQSNEVEFIRGNKICDNRYENCRYSTIFGKNLLNVTLACSGQQITVGPDGQKNINIKKSECKASVISSTQLFCQLESSNSYKITLEWVESTNEPKTFEFTHIKYDSECYTCDKTSVTCKRKTELNHCVVNGKCYAPGQEFVSNSCLYCEPGNATDHLTLRSENKTCLNQYNNWVQDKRNRENDRRIRIVVASVLSALVILIAVIIFFVSKKMQSEGSNTNHNFDNQKAKHTYDNTTYVTPDNVDMSTYNSIEIKELTVNSSKLENGSLANAVVTPQSKTQHHRQASQTSEQNNEVAELINLKNHLKQRRLRTTSVGSQSARSIGLGGGGPIYAARTQHLSSMEGIGGHMYPENHKCETEETNAILNYRM